MCYENEGDEGKRKRRPMRNWVGGMAVTGSATNSIETLKPKTKTGVEPSLAGCCCKKQPRSRMQNVKGSAQLRLTSRKAEATAFRKGRLIGSVLDQRAVESHGEGIGVGGMDVHL
jgi:hypothetical protein